jgi:hypothetical protein
LPAERDLEAFEVAKMEFEDKGGFGKNILKSWV